MSEIISVGSADRSHEMPYDEMGHAACVSEIIYNICICRQGGHTAKTAKFVKPLFPFLLHRRRGGGSLASVFGRGKSAILGGKNVRCPRSDYSGSGHYCDTYRGTGCPVRCCARLYCVMDGILIVLMDGIVSYADAPCDPLRCGARHG